MRIGEALQLELDDIDLNRDPVRISIRGEYTKGGDPRIAFISSETKECIVEWLKVRKQYLESASNRSTRYEKSTEDNRLFPFHFSTARFMLVRALEKSGFDERDKSTKIYRIHPHSLRKFFRTEMGAVIPVDIVEALMGHKSYLTQVYRRYSVDQLADFYKKGETEITIFGKVEEMKEVRRDVRVLEAVIHDQRESIKGLVHALHELEDRLSLIEQKRENEELRKTL